MRSYVMAVIVAGLLPACATPTFRHDPPDALVSPKADLARIKKVAVLPLLTRKPVADTMALMFAEPDERPNPDLFLDQLDQSLSSNVQRARPEWSVVPASAVVSAISSGNLVPGYKSLQADFNTIPGNKKALEALSPESVEFLKSVQAATGADALLIGYYCFTAVSVTQDYSVEKYPGISVNTALYLAPDHAIWWYGTLTRYGPASQDVEDLASSLAAAVGKGVLSQL